MTVYIEFTVETPEGDHLTLGLNGEKISALLKQWGDEIKPILVKTGYSVVGPAAQAAPEAPEAPAAGEVRTLQIYGHLEYAGLTQTTKQPFWRLMTEGFMKHGIPVYSEAIQAAASAGVFWLDPGAELDPREQYDLTGVIAHILYNDAGNPKKVVRLERLGA